MANTQMSSPIIVPQEPSPQLVTSDQDSIQKHQHDQTSISLYQSQPYEQERLSDMTREFLIQDITGDPSHGPQTLLQIPHTAPSSSPSSTSSSSTTYVDEELNIYDYIHAKQEEDEDEHDGDDHGHALNHEHGPDPISVSADANAPDTFHTMQRSPVLSASSPVLSVHSPSSPTFSVLSPSSPSSSSDVQHYDHSASTATTIDNDKDQLQHDSNILAAIQVKQECIDTTSLLGHHSSYMDSSMELYGSTHSPLLSSQSDLMPTPPQDLFRVLMEELQTQASIQREKFFSATTGSGTGIDSVEFLFNGPQTQEQHQQIQLQRSVPQFMMETATASPDMLSKNATPGVKVGSTAQESSGLGSISESSASTQMDNLSVAPLDFTRAPLQVSTELIHSDNKINNNNNNNNSSNNNDDVNMETVEPEGDIPLSPVDSSFSSGSVTPELTSPILQPCPSLSSFLTRSPPSAEVVRVAFMRFGNQRSKPSEVDSEVQQPLDSRKDSIPSILSSITELSFKSAIDNNNSRRRSSSSVKDESLCSSVIAMHSVPRKKRKLSRDSENQSPAGSPRLSALPSPPSSVRTTPPLQPMMMDTSSNVESLSLSPDYNDQEINYVDIAEPITPTSPLLPKSAIKQEAMGSDTIMEFATSETDSKPLSSDSNSGTSKSSTNANNKRSWTSEEEALLLKLVESKTPIKDIAETLNRSVHSVRSRRQVLTDPGFVKGNGHAQPRRSKPDPSSKLPTYSQMAFLSLARLPDFQGTLNDVASMVEKLFSRHLNRIPRTGHKNLQIWRAQISDALAHEKGHPRPRFESFGVKRGRQWVYRLTNFGKGVMNAMGCVDQICEDLLKNNEIAGGGFNCGPDGESSGPGGAGAGLGQGNGYGYSYCPEAANTPTSPKSTLDSSLESDEESNAENIAASNAIANAMAAMAAGLAAMTAAEDERSASVVSAATHVLAVVPSVTAAISSSPSNTTTTTTSKKAGSLAAPVYKVQAKEKHGRISKTSSAVSANVRSGRKTKA
ncbi:hypothetical protein BGZ49_001583 [Haplosporangium sp. Z 27]|nr:hypothetical protein BGZ49_001583 [Haplosporangium sp. Z 27]